ncbi:hypothetical protein GUITHDRAFT_100429 [Guillardia theta CCMP2712]|uniref:Uncharacterized protein n=1 Tax=Guillardia theta (strain CCMP2712) TaxID=905079 RepID=L1JZZ6_GUITC|nr:hypothetical protein GUITHDRAFT_100429 [Guillardia theta CCMP2712]EKX54181.1 hypothetical protein GUITHDRAFT_100429 [Guillardia theta CCMP2712]|eukprot:XP_005841161.1 hypothetical protein GUITHDRAFT_100429 [Guillardia theta CCMP2712]
MSTSRSRGKTGLDEVIAERLERQRKKTSKQLYIEKSLEALSKVGNLEKIEARTKHDFSYIPGRSTAPENSRSVEKRKQEMAKLQAKQARAHIDWSETDDYGNLLLSASAHSLQLETLPQTISSGPVYPRGVTLESLNLAEENLKYSNSKTFEILEPSSLHELDRSRRFVRDYKSHENKFVLQEKDLEHELIDVASGAIKDPFLHLSQEQATDDEIFRISQAFQRSTNPQLLDLYGSYLQAGPAVFMFEQMQKAMAGGNVAELRSLSFDSSTLGPTLYSHLRGTFRVAKSLTSLNLSNLFYPMRDVDGAQLARELSSTRSLQTLNVSGNLLGKQTCWELKNWLLSNDTLRVLNLECNVIDDDAMFNLVEGLKRNSKIALESVYLGFNQIDHYALGSLMELCGQAHSKLRLLDLRSNKVSRCSTGRVREGLSRSPCLAVLNLADNRLSDVSEIGYGLHWNKSVQEVDLSRNMIQDDTFQWMELWGKNEGRIYLANSKVQRLDLRGNRLGDVAGLQIIKHLKRREMFRTMELIQLEDNFIDPSWQIKRRSKRLIKQKVDKTSKYWKERDWEQLQMKRKRKVDEAVRLLKNRTADEVEIDAVVQMPWVSKVPIVRTIAWMGSQYFTGSKPVWKIQEEILYRQKVKVEGDIKNRKNLVKGVEQT